MELTVHPGCMAHGHVRVHSVQGLSIRAGKFDPVFDQPERAKPCPGSRRLPLFSQASRLVGPVPIAKCAFAPLAYLDLSGKRGRLRRTGLHPAR